MAAPTSDELPDELLAAQVRRGSRGSPRACPGSPRCVRDPGPRAGAPRRRRPPPAGRAAARSCRPRRRWSACRPWGAGTAERSRRFPERIIASVQVASSRGERPRKNTAISSAEACSSATEPCVYSCEEPADPLVRELLAVALGADDVNGRGRHRPARASTSSGPEGARQQVAEGRRAQRPRPPSTSRSGPAVLVEQLPAAPAGRQRTPVAGHDRHGHQASAAGGGEVGHQPALGAEGDAVAGVLDVAAAHQPAVPGHAARRPPARPSRARRSARSSRRASRRRAGQSTLTPRSPGAAAARPSRAAGTCRISRDLGQPRVRLLQLGRARGPTSRGTARGCPRRRAPAPARCPTAPSCRSCRRRPARTPMRRSTRA